MKYAKHLPALERRETWEEICIRNRDMHIRKYPKLTDEITAVYADFVIPKKVLPSMRSMQFAGKSIEISNNRMYNCCYVSIDNLAAFPETMFLLLGGTGVGYSVQKHHVAKLPEIKIPKKERRFLVGDSIEGWADAVKVLVKAYFTGTYLPIFDFRDIRPKGAMLVTSGGKAPGPEPLKECLFNLRTIFERKQPGECLTTLEVHDMLCHIADSVLAGGIRRAAMIALFSLDDEDMLTCKFGDWYEQNPQRARANNTATVLRSRVQEEDFWKLWAKIEASGSGEPGLYFTNDVEYGTNPCAEISLRPNGFCNLTTINAGTLLSQQDYNERATAAAFIGTLQAGYTDFHYLRDIWKKTAEEDALIGVSMTGIADGTVLALNIAEAAACVVAENKRVAALIGINEAARSTCIKPEGTASGVVGTASGNHARHANYYLRRVRVAKNEAIYTYLNIFHPELLEDDFFKPTTTAIITIPQKSPPGSILRTESPIDLLERVKRLHTEWIQPGHASGPNTHNVSTTVPVRANEWNQVGRWMWENRESFTALSVFPYDDHTYVQAPFEDCTKETYDRLMKDLSEVDLTQVVEMNDGTNLAGELACAGGACEIK